MLDGELQYRIESSELELTVPEPLVPEVEDGQLFFSFSDVFVASCFGAYNYILLTRRH